MGAPGAWVYGEDVGSAIETAKATIQKIETNKYDNKDLIELVKATNDIIVGILTANEQEN